MSLKKNKGEGSIQIDLSMNIEGEKDTGNDNEETEEALEQETVEPESGKEKPAKVAETCENQQSANGLDKDVEQERRETKLHPPDSIVSHEVIYFSRPKTSLWFCYFLPCISFFVVPVYVQ